MTATVVFADSDDSAAIVTALETLAPAATDKFGFVKTNGTKVAFFKVTV